MTDRTPADRSPAGQARTGRAYASRARAGRVRAALLLIAAVTAPLCAGARTLVSPNDPIYGHLRTWEQRGLIGWLPPLRPLPAPIVRAALQRVADAGPAADRRIARRLLARYFRPLPVRGQAGIGVRSKATAGGALPAQIAAQLGAGVEAPISDHVGFGFAARARPASVVPAPVTPLLTFDPYDYIAPGDRTTILGEEFDFRVELAGNAYVGASAPETGVDTWFVQAGFGRSSFGYGRDSTIVSDAAAPAGYVTGAYRGSWIAYSAMFLDLIAAYGTCSGATPAGVACDAQGRYPLRDRARIADGRHPSKYLVVQSLSFYPADWLELTALQSVLFGGRFSPTYLLPVFPSIYTQMQLYDYDNAFLGAAARVRLPYGASLGAVLYVDDINLTKIRRFDFDSDQNKLAVDLEAGIAPPLPILTYLSARYRMVTPYLYAHHPAALDYLTYTHAGRHLGTMLDPNSDELRVSARAFPLDWIGIDLSLRRVRHGGPAGGSVWDHGLVDGAFVFYGPSTFLKQDVLEHVLQARAGIDLHVDLQPVELHLGLSYTYQQVNNRDLEPGADEQAHLFEVSTAVRY